MTLRTIKTKLVHRVRTLVTRTVEEKVYDSLLLQGRIASWQVRSMQSIQSLQDAEFKVLSQWGEDGIIDWLIERAAIPVGRASPIGRGGRPTIVERSRKTRHARTHDERARRQQLLLALNAKLVQKNVT